jgi:hypothetical protein
VPLFLVVLPHGHCNIQQASIPQRDLLAPTMGSESRTLLPHTRLAETHPHPSTGSSSRTLLPHTRLPPSPLYRQ